MMILMLAVTMTVATLIGTAFSLYEESRRQSQSERLRASHGFGFHY